MRTILLFALAAGVVASAQPATPVTAVVGATLIDGTDRPPITDAVVVMKDGRVAAVGRRGEVSIPAGAEVVSAAGKYIIPGLIDGHVHYRSWVGELFLNHGVTSVIDVGNDAEWMIALRAGFAKDKIERVPRIYAAGRILDGSVPPGTRQFSSVIGIITGTSPHLIVDDPPAARKQLALATGEQGFDLVKVFQHLAPAVRRAIVEEAHAHGKKVVGHTTDIYESLDAGMDGVVHLTGVAMTTMTPADREAVRQGQVVCPYARIDLSRTPELIDTMKRRGAFINLMPGFEHQAFTPRAAAFKAEVARLLGNPDLQYIPIDARLSMLFGFDRALYHGRRLGSFPYVDALSAAERAEFDEGYRRGQAFARQLAAANGRLWLGTDTGGTAVVPGLSLHHDMQLLVDAGFTPLQVLQAASRAPAELLGKGDEIGTIQPGRFADLLVLDADPLQDIANTRRIAMVFQTGRRVALGYRWNYTIPISNPVASDRVMVDYLLPPRIEEAVPKLATEGSGGITLRVAGRDFTVRSTVWFGGVPLPTRFESAEALSADIPASLLTAVGTWPVRVINPPPGGGASNSIGFIVQFR